MNISWYGQASFLLEATNGLRVVTDPYNHETSGFKPFPDAADVIIMSSDNDSFHCNHQLVPKRDGATVINALEVARNGGALQSHGITFYATESMEHAQHDTHDPDHNAMYKFELDGICFGHMGDMGNAFNEQQMDFFKNVDVLLALAGGFPVIALDELKRIINETNPRLVIPMHFRTLCYKPRTMFFINEFLSYFDPDRTDFAFSHQTQLNKNTLPDTTRVLVLDYL